MKQQLHIEKPFALEAGEVLPSLSISYTTLGTLSAAKDNVVWICHAFTANSNPTEWWGGLVGKGKFFNPEEYYIVCANIIGSCYGTTGPDSWSDDGTLYGEHFPLVSIRDLVQAHILLAEHLGIETIHCCIGGSMGGQQVLEWAIIEPQRIKNIVVIACGAQQSPWAKAFNTAQRLALEADIQYPWRKNGGTGEHGLKAARAIAFLSYRSYDSFCNTQKDEEGLQANCKAESYLRYQGWKLAQRFSAHSYWSLSKTMDTHNVGRGRGGVELALKGIQAQSLIISISSDILFPEVEQQQLAAHIPGSILRRIDSEYGHDGFLLEYLQLTALLEEFLDGKQDPSLRSLLELV